MSDIKTVFAVANSAIALTCLWLRATLSEWQELAALGSTLARSALRERLRPTMPAHKAAS